MRCARFWESLYIPKICSFKTSHKKYTPPVLKTNVSRKISGYRRSAAGYLHFFQTLEKNSHRAYAEEEGDGKNRGSGCRAGRRPLPCYRRFVSILVARALKTRGRGPAARGGFYGFFTEFHEK
jgi:hypothetical protein